MLCKKCGNNLADTAKFCGKCGESVVAVTPVQPSVEVSSSCPQCGAVCKPDAKFCPKCGYSFGAAASEKVSTSEKLPVAPSSPSPVPQESEVVVTAAPVQAEKIVPAASEKAASVVTTSVKSDQPPRPVQPAQPTQLASTPDDVGTGAPKFRSPIMIAAGVAAAAVLLGGGYWFFVKPSQTPDSQAIALEQPNQASTTSAAPSMTAEDTAASPQQPAPGAGVTGIISDLEDALRCKGLENTDAIEAAVKNAGFERMRAPDEERKYNASKITLFGVPVESVSFYGNNASEMVGVDAVLVTPKSVIAGKVAKLTTLKSHQFDIQASGTDKTRVVCALDGGYEEDEPVAVVPPVPVHVQPKQAPVSTPQKRSETAAPPAKQVAPSQPAKTSSQTSTTKLTTKPNLEEVYTKGVAEKGCAKGFLGLFCRETLKTDICRQYKAFGKDSFCPSSDPKDNPNGGVPKYGN